MQTVAFDLETTGFDPDDLITVIGFDMPMGSRVFLNTGGRLVGEGLDQRLNERITGITSLSVYEDEGEMLQQSKAFAVDKFPRGTPVLA